MHYIIATRTPVTIKFNYRRGVTASEVINLYSSMFSFKEAIAKLLGNKNLYSMLVI